MTAEERKEYNEQKKKDREQKLRMRLLTGGGVLYAHEM